MANPISLASGRQVPYSLHSVLYHHITDIYIYIEYIYIYREREREKIDSAGHPISLYGVTNMHIYLLFLLLEYEEGEHDLATWSSPDASSSDK